MKDNPENAYEKLVHELLDSLHWGEHRARTWLEAARYAETHALIRAQSETELCLVTARSQAALRHFNAYG